MNNIKFIRNLVVGLASAGVIFVATGNMAFAKGQSLVSAKLSTPFNAICKLAMVLIFIMRKDHAQTKQSRMAQFD